MTTQEIIFKTVPTANEIRLTKADMANPKQHGRVMMTSLVNGDGGGVFCWDYHKQKIVKQDELTK
jgi:hypothetical protein